MTARLITSIGLPVHVVTAGTHVVENQPMSRRTRAAMLSIGLEPGHHRSHQLTASDVDRADLVIAMAREHVAYVRRHYPSAAHKTATIDYLSMHLSAGDGPLAERVARLTLEAVDPVLQGDVPDPAGGEEPEYIACAQRLRTLVGLLSPALH